MTGLALPSTALMTLRRLGWVERLGRAEFADVGAAGKSRAGTDQNDRFDAGIGVGALDARDDRLAQFMTQTVDRGIVESQDRDCAVDLEASLFMPGRFHHVVPLCGTEFRPIRLM